MATHDEKNHKCNRCDAAFKTKIRLSKHVERMHELNRLLYKCDICNKDFKDKGYLSLHKKIHNGTDTKPHSCSICGDKFIFPNRLKFHMYTKHEKRLEIPCAICHKTFKQKRCLDKHTKHFHGDGEQGVACQLCDKVLYDSRVLKNHILAVHEGIKKYKCDFCEAGFSHKVSLSNHIKQCHLKYKVHFAE